MALDIYSRQCEISAGGRRWIIGLHRHPATSPFAGEPAVLITADARDNPPIIDPASPALAEAEATGGPLAAAVRAFRAMEPRGAQEADWRPLYEAACSALGLAPL